mmetsp:Transcript_26706/g.35086  ORF Transcript_26706/g.35086 Transcript_26706/m.35086 type:complete len:130 (+) Transcript_26706:2-391(+)
MEAQMRRQQQQMDEMNGLGMEPQMRHQHQQQMRGGMNAPVGQVQQMGGGMNAPANCLQQMGAGSMGMQGGAASLPGPQPVQGSDQVGGGTPFNGLGMVAQGITRDQRGGGLKRAPDMYGGYDGMKRLRY